LVLEESVVSRLALDVGASNLPGLFRIFAEEIKQISEQLQHTDDEENVARLAHRLKGAAANYGAARLRQDAGLLELSARQGRSELSPLKRQVCLSVLKTIEATKKICLSGADPVANGDEPEINDGITIVYVDVS